MAPESVDAHLLRHIHALVDEVVVDGAVVLMVGVDLLVGRNGQFLGRFEKHVPASRRHFVALHELRGGIGVSRLCSAVGLQSRHIGLGLL